MNQILKFVEKWASGGAFAWIVLFFIFSALLINNPGFGQGHLEKISGGLGMADMRLFNTPGELVHYLEELGAAGRESYLRILVLDFFVIAGLFMLNAAVVFRLLEKNGWIGKGSWLIMPVLLRALCDLVGNIAMFVNTLFFPGQIRITLFLASAATPLQWVFMWSSISVLLVMLIRQVFRRIRIDGTGNKLLGRNR